MVTTKDAQQDKQIAVLCTNMSGVDKRLEKIETNHLPHIQEAIAKLDEERINDKEEIKKEINKINIFIAKLVGGFAVLSILSQVFFKILG